MFHFPTCASMWPYEKCSIYYQTWQSRNIQKVSLDNSVEFPIWFYRLHPHPKMKKSLRSKYCWEIKMQRNPWKIVQEKKIMSWWRFHAGAEMLQDALCFYDTWVTCLRNWNYLDIAAHPKLLTNSSKAFGTTFWVVRWGTLGLILYWCCCQTFFSIMTWTHATIIII